MLMENVASSIITGISLKEANQSKKFNIFSFFNYSKFSKDEKHIIVLLFAVNSFLSLVFLVWCLQFFYSYFFDGHIFLNLLKGIVHFAIGIFSILNLFILKISAEIVLFLFSLEIFIYTIIMYFVFSNSILCSPIVLTCNVFTLFNIFLSKKTYVHIIWIISFVVLICVEVPYDLFFVDYNYQFERFLAEKVIAHLAFYSSTHLSSIVVIIIFFAVQKKRNQEMKSMENVGQLICNLEEVDSNKKLAKLKKKKDYQCSNLELVLKNILIKIEYYASFLPENLKPDYLFDETKEKSITQSSNSVYSSTSSDTADSFYQKAQSSSSFGSNGKKKENQKKKQKEITLRKVSILLIDIKEFHKTIFGDYFEELDNKSISKLEEKSKAAINEFNNFISKIQEITPKYSGIMENIEGDKLLITWNVVRRNVEHEINALLFASEVLETIETNLSYRISICTGNVLFGNVGSSNFKRFVRFSPIINFLYFLSDLKIGNSTSSEIVVNQDMYDAAHYNFQLKKIEQVQLSKNKNNRIEDVYIFLGKKDNLKAQKKEWLYQLSEDFQKKGTDDVWDEIWECMNNKNYEKAKILLGEYRKMEKKNEKGLDYIFNKINKEESFTVF